MTEFYVADCTTYNPPNRSNDERLKNGSREYCREKSVPQCIPLRIDAQVCFQWETQKLKALLKYSVHDIYTIFPWI